MTATITSTRPTPTDPTGLRRIDPFAQANQQRIDALKARLHNRETPSWVVEATKAAETKAEQACFAILGTPLDPRRPVEESTAHVQERLVEVFTELETALKGIADRRADLDAAGHLEQKRLAAEITRLEETSPGVTPAGH